MPEIIRDGEIGLLAETGQAEPLAEALIALLGNPERAEQLGHAANRHVAHGHTWDDVVRRMAPYIEQTVAERSPVRYREVNKSA
jgi:glycosyltransferase involved in cell wall biosynthesis